MDLDNLAGIFTGLGEIFETVNTTDVDTRYMMGKWHQMYKAAINFDVFRTQMYCPVSYCKTITRVYKKKVLPLPICHLNLRLG